VLAACNVNLEGYSIIYVDASDFRLSRFDGVGSRSDLDSTTSTLDEPIEVVIDPPASGESGVSGAVYELDGNLNRLGASATLSDPTESTYAGQRGIGIVGQSKAGTGTIADEIRIGRSL
jgi:hypothetical protein